MSLIEQLNGDQFFLPLLEDRELEEMKSGMTKTDVKKLMEMEEKRGRSNEKLSHFAQEDQRERRTIIEKKRMVQVEKEELTREQYEKRVTITGTFEEVEKQYRQHRDRMYIQRDRIRNLTFEVEKDIERLKDKREVFIGKALITMMETENVKDEIEQKKRAKQEKNDPKWKEFLKGIQSLPDDVIQYIGTYLSYETIVANLEHSFHITQWFNTLKKRNALVGVIKQIYKHKHIVYNELEIKTKMKHLYKYLFTNGHDGKKKPSLTGLKQMIRYLFVLFRKYGFHEQMCSLYRDFAVIQQYQVSKRNPK
jgi:hypothetical protein